MGDDISTTGGLYPDEALFLDTSDAHAFLSLYARHRDSVCAELETAGLSRREAETRINEVFVRMMDGRSGVDRSRRLAETLRGFARVVVGLTNHTDGRAVGAPGYIESHTAISGSSGAP